jgi:hypothetical protein
MIPADPVLLREIPVIQKIIQDETWLEGERRGCSVAPSDRVVREKVCEVILRIGQQLRDSLSATTTNATPDGPPPMSVTNVADNPSTISGPRV